MASWWKSIVANTGAANSSGGAYAKRVANKFGAQSAKGAYERKIGSHQHFGTTGSFGRRLVNFSGTITKTPYNTAGSYGRQIKNQNLLV